MAAMKLLALSCNNCGAPLEAPAKAKFLTCRYCDSRLAVKHTGSAYYTELIEKLDQRTKEIAGEVEVLQIQNKILQLDNQWMDERDGHMGTDQYGRRSLPSKAGGVIAGLGGVVPGIVLMVWVCAGGAPGFLALVGVFLVIFGIASAVWAFSNAERFEWAQSQYESRRDTLTEQLREVEGDALWKQDGSAEP
jgi:DNA-directed RNA polymerase subunit RPC12/RpoP